MRGGQRMEGSEREREVGGANNENIQKWYSDLRTQNMN